MCWLLNRSDQLNDAFGILECLPQRGFRFVYFVRIFCFSGNVILLRTILCLEAAANCFALLVRRNYSSPFWRNIMWRNIILCSEMLSLLTIMSINQIESINLILATRVLGIFTTTRKSACLLAVEKIVAN